MKFRVTFRVTKPLFFVYARNRKPDEVCKQVPFFSRFRRGKTTLLLCLLLII
nr:MAG TPA: Dynamin family [Caudoviricetes sp.]